MIWQGLSSKTGKDALNTKLFTIFSAASYIIPKLIKIWNPISVLATDISSRKNRIEVGWIYSTHAILYVIQALILGTH